MAEFSSYNKLLRALRKWSCDPCAVVVCVDIRDLRNINHIGGARAGDDVIRKVSARVRAWAGPQGHAERLWSNEFIAARLIDHPQGAIEEAARLRDELAGISYQSPIGDNRIGVAIGFTVARSGADWPRTIDDASEACGAAKRRGVNQIVSRVPQDTLQNRAQHETDLIRNFRLLMSEGRLVPYPQPIMHIGSAQPRLAKAEFLLRVEQGGHSQPLPPGTIEILEHYGLSVELDGYVTQRVLDWLSAHPQVTARLDNVSMNLSANSLVDGNFMDGLLREVRQQRVPPHKLCFEITETAAVQNLEVAAEVVGEFRRIGCKWSLDDFGSGLCSFGYLNSLPVDEVKIDGRFTRDVYGSVVSQEIVRAINQVAHATGKKTVAEFVDDNDKLETLRKIGVDYAQGWLFSPAVTQERFLQMLDQPGRQVAARQTAEPVRDALLF